MPFVICSDRRFYGSLQGWSLSQGTDLETWDYYASHPEMADRFGDAMSAFTNGLGNSPEFLVKDYPWSSVGGGTGTVVDIGGSKGTTCVAIARSAPGLKFVVQELPDMIRGAKETIPADVTDRIEFVVHDFFTEQRVTADVYLFRYIFHNWSDQHVIKILRALIPALKPGSRIMVHDTLNPEPKTLSPSKERTVR